MDQILLDYQKAKLQAKTLEELASKLRTISESEYGQTIQSISNNWKSDSAYQYLNKANNLKSNILTSADDLERIAGNIRNTAKKIYDAEKLAEKIAKERTSK